MPAKKITHKIITASVVPDAAPTIPTAAKPVSIEAAAIVAKPEVNTGEKNIQEKKVPEKKDKKPKKAGGKDSTKVNKVNVVRDSFTMPQSDYAKIDELKQTCLAAGLQVKKSELLRAGLLVLSKLSVAQLKKTITQMEQIKTGRPKSN